MRKLSIPGLIALCAGLLTAVAQAQEHGLASVPAALVSLPTERIFDGVVEPINQSTVSAQTLGRIVEIHFDVDDVVPKDSVLVRFHDAEARARLEQEQASLKDAQARLKIASEENQRVRNLIERKLVSQSDADRADAVFNSATANVELAKARIAQAQQQLDYTVVRAPFSGVVLTRHVQLGETVQVGQPLMTGFSLDSLRVASTIPQDLVLLMREHTSARVLTDDRSVPVDAQAVTIFPYADKTSHTFKVWLGLPEKFPGLYPGMLVKVAFVVGEQKRLLIPRDSVVQRSEVTGVYVVNAAGEASFRRILAGREVDSNVEIISGLSEGEQVALDPIAATSRAKAGKH